MESKNKENPNEDIDNFEIINSIKPIIPTKKDESSKNEIESNKIIIEPKINLVENELKIELYPNNIPKGKLKKIAISSVMPKDRLGCSLAKK